MWSVNKQQHNEITISRKFLSPGENVLIIDDFLAHGEAAFGMARIVESAGASLVGIGIVIEKSFQSGTRKLKEAGYGGFVKLWPKGFTLESYKKIMEEPYFVHSFFVSVKRVLIGGAINFALTIVTI